MQFFRVIMLRLKIYFISLGFAFSSGFSYADIVFDGALTKGIFLPIKVLKLMASLSMVLWHLMVLPIVCSVSSIRRDLVNPWRSRHASPAMRRRNGGYRSEMSALRILFFRSAGILGAITFPIRGKPGKLCRYCPGS